MWVSISLQFIGPKRSNFLVSFQRMIRWFYRKLMSINSGSGFIKYKKIMSRRCTNYFRNLLSDKHQPSFDLFRGSHHWWYFFHFLKTLEKTNSFTENYHCSVPRAQASPNVPEGNAFFVNISTTTMAVGRKTGCIKSWCDELWVWPVWPVRHSDRFVIISFGKYIARFRQ